MSDEKTENNATTSQRPITKIKDISLMKAWKDSKVGIEMMIIGGFQMLFVGI